MFDDQKCRAVRLSRQLLSRANVRIQLQAGFTSIVVVVGSVREPGTTTGSGLDLLYRPKRVFAMSLVPRQEVLVGVESSYEQIDSCLHEVRLINPACSGAVEIM
jgi:hypothetical protein